MREEYSSFVLMLWPKVSDVSVSDKSPGIETLISATIKKCQDHEKVKSFGNGDQLEELQVLEKTEEGHTDMHKEAEISTASMLIHNEKCRRAYLSHWQIIISHLQSLCHTVKFPFNALHKIDHCPYNKPLFTGYCELVSVSVLCLQIDTN